MGATLIAGVFITAIGLLEIRSDNAPTTPALKPGLMTLLRSSVLCNGAELRLEAVLWHIVGDPTEGALLVAAAKAGLTKNHLEQENLWLRRSSF